jgi:hypothetical protein
MNGPLILENTVTVSSLSDLTLVLMLHRAAKTVLAGNKRKVKPPPAGLDQYRPAWNRFQ